MQCWFYVLAFLATNAILLLRTSAIWENKRKIAFPLFALLIACITGTGYFMQKFIMSLDVIPSPSRSVYRGCFVISSGRIIWVAISLLLLFHTVVLVLTLISVIRQRILRKSSLFRTIYRDGIIVYTYLFGIALINITVINTAPILLAYSLVSFHRVLQAILTERLVINILKAAADRRKISETVI